MHFVGDLGCGQRPETNVQHQVTCRECLLKIFISKFGEKWRATTVAALSITDDYIKAFTVIRETIPLIESTPQFTIEPCSAWRAPKSIPVSTWVAPKPNYQFSWNHLDYPSMRFAMKEEDLEQYLSGREPSQ